MFAFDGNYQQNVDNFSARLYASHRRVALYAPHHSTEIEQDIVKSGESRLVIFYISLHPLHVENMAHIGSLKHFVLVFVKGNFIQGVFLGGLKVPSTKK